MRLLVCGIVAVMLFINLAPVGALSRLRVTVQTSEPFYHMEENIEAHGQLTYNDYPVQGVLVSLLVMSPRLVPMFSRSVYTDEDGMFSNVFKLGSNADLGTYTILVTARYAETATANVTFRLTIPEDVNGDGRVDMQDVIQVCAAFGSSGDGEAYWHNPVQACCPHSSSSDIDHNGRVDTNDVMAIVNHFGERYL